MKKILFLFFLFAFWISAVGQLIERIETAGGCGVKAKRGEIKSKRDVGDILFKEERFLRSVPPNPETADPTVLFVDKSSDGSVLYLSWNEDDSPFIVSRSTDPSFQSGVEILEKDAAIGETQIGARTDKTLECFDVSGGSVLSYPSQGIGYDPDPSPSIPTVASNVLWWGDPFDISANYL